MPERRDPFDPAIFNQELKTKELKEDRDLER